MIADFLFYHKSNIETTDIHEGIKFLKSKHTYHTSHEVGSFIIDIFSKYDYQNKDNQIIFFGFLAYKGLYNEEAAQKLIKEDQPDWHQAYGDYCILYQNKNNQIDVILDPLRKYHVFKLKQKNVLSSSFLAISHAAKTLSLDDDAIYERLAIGYNIAPSTIFNEIERLYYPDEVESKTLNLNDNRINFSFKNYASEHEALNKQKETLIQQFKAYEAFLQETKSDIGVSDGMDSRLLLSVISQLSVDNIQLHTHANEGTESHTASSKIAKEIADTVNLPLVKVSNKKLLDMNAEELQDSFWDNFIYFDGRNAYNMGSMAPNYTKKYKDKVMGDALVSFNGIGGEVFRNYYYTRKGKRNFKVFAENWLLYIYSKDFLPKDKYNQFWQNYNLKLEKRLGVKVTNRENIGLIRRYYSEIFMPDCDAINNTAHNKFYYFLTPFIEPSVLQSAYGIEPYLGLSIKFEGKLIKSLYPELAKINTHYGYIDSFKKNYKQQIKYLVNAYGPQQLFRYRLNIAKWVELKNQTNNNLLKHIEENAPWFYEAWMFLQQRYSEVDFRYIVISSDTALNNTFMLANSIYYFKNKIKL